MSLKESWKETGEAMLNAFTVLGKTVVKTTKEGIRKLDEWANSEKKQPAEEQPAAEAETETNDEVAD